MASFKKKRATVLDCRYDPRLLDGLVLLSFLGFESVLVFLGDPFFVTGITSHGAHCHCGSSFLSANSKSKLALGDEHDPAAGGMR
jgi:hypothetical protein